MADFSQQLNIGDEMHWNDNLWAPNSNCWLTFQDDGNLVAYRLRPPDQGGGMEVYWTAQTAGKGGVRLTMQADGNLVMYNSSEVAVWSADTYGRHGNPGSRASLQDDQNFVVYDSAGGAQWASNTGWNGPGLVDT